MKIAKKEAGFGIIEIIVVICIVVAVGFTGWYIWRVNQEHAKMTSITSYDECVAAGNVVQESYPSVCVTQDGERFTNPNEKLSQQLYTGIANQATKTVLQISQWDVEIPVDAKSNDLLYHYAKTGDAETVTFSFAELQEKSMCTNGVGVTLTRKKTENEPPFNTDNPQSFKQLRNYYYYVATDDTPCYDTTNASKSAVVKQIAGSQTLQEKVVALLKDLRITDN